MLKIKIAKNRHRTSGTLALMLLLSLTLTACFGGGSESPAESGGTSSTTPPPPTPPAAADDSQSVGGADSDGDGVTVTMGNFAFTPQEIRVKAGTTVTFKNVDQIAHDVVQATPENLNSGTPGFSSPQIMAGSTWSRTFDEPGEYPILCTVGSHYILGMTATVIVE